METICFSLYNDSISENVKKRKEARMKIQLQICGIVILSILLFFYHGQKRLNLRTEIAFQDVLMVF